MTNRLLLKGVQYYAKISKLPDAKKRVVLDNTVMDAILEGKKVFIVVVDNEAIEDD